MWSEDPLVIDARVLNGVEAPWLRKDDDASAEELFEAAKSFALSVSNLAKKSLPEIIFQLRFEFNSEYSAGLIVLASRLDQSGAKMERKTIEKCVSDSLNRQLHRVKQSAEKTASPAVRPLLNDACDRHGVWGLRLLGFDGGDSLWAAEFSALFEAREVRLAISESSVAQSPRAKSL